MPTAMDLTVRPAGRLVGPTIHRSLHPGDPQGYWATINLRGLQWVDPAGLVALAVFAEEQASMGRRPYVFAPSDATRARYLSRMHLPWIIEELEGGHDLPQTTEWQQSDRLLELQRFDGRDAAEHLGFLVHERLEDPELAHAMHASICEVGINVPDHSGRQHGYIAAATTYQSSRISFAVGDAGVGVLEPLLHRGYRTHGEVLRDLFEIGVSRTDVPGRGLGIIRTRRLVNDRQGQVFMSSGPAAVTAWPGYVQQIGHTEPLGGTILQGEMPCG